MNFRKPISLSSPQNRQNIQFNGKKSQFNLLELSEDDGYILFHTIQRNEIECQSEFWFLWNLNLNSWCKEICSIERFLYINQMPSAYFFSLLNFLTSQNERNVFDSRQLQALHQFEFSSLLLKKRTTFCCCCFYVGSDCDSIAL